MTVTNHQIEIEKGERFAFGKNWARFLDVLDEDRVVEAQNSLTAMLGLKTLEGLTFLDAGSGSGLFSLAAHRLGANVRSFDYDPKSVAASCEMRRRYGSELPWHIDVGSVLDLDFLKKLGCFDIVYCWGVMHHTGDMWQAMQNVIPSVNPGGKLFIALYNDQGLTSAFWARVKRTYCAGILGRIVVIPVFFTAFALAGLISDLTRRKNPVRRYIDYRRKRGMSIIHDWIDWIGGYPYQVAKPEEVFSFYHRRGFRLINLTTRQSLGCNEFVFVRCEQDTQNNGTGPGT